MLLICIRTSMGRHKVAKCAVGSNISAFASQIPATNPSAPERTPRSAKNLPQEQSPQNPPSVPLTIKSKLSPQRGYCIVAVSSCSQHGYCSAAELAFDNTSISSLGTFWKRKKKVPAKCDRQDRRLTETCLAMKRAWQTTCGQVPRSSACQDGHWE